MFSKRVRIAWSFFNVAITVVLLPLFLMSKNNSCDTPRIFNRRDIHAAPKQDRRRESSQEDEEEAATTMMMMMGKGRVKGLVVGGCGPPGVGTFSPVRLRSTALASYQGSGNTWARHLLTTATGILTGTVYPNETREVPAGPRISRAYRLLVIKTHMNPRQSRNNFPVDRGILIVRNPYEAILSEFNRGGINHDDEHADRRHIAVRQPEDFRRRWPKFVENQMVMWLRFNWYWAKDSAPLHVLVYHRLVENTGQELRNVLRFLNESSIKPTIHCATKNSEGWAHRKKPGWQNEAAIFNATQTTFVNIAIDRIRKALEAKTGEKFDDLLRWKR